MTVDYIATLTARYERLGYTPYQWFRAETAPALEKLSKPLSHSTVGVVSTAGAYVIGQAAYYYKDDTSTRGIAADTPSERIHFSHLTENYLVDPRKDPNCILPIEPLREMASSGRIGALAPELLSCMGAIYSQRRVREELIPRLHEQLDEQSVDAVLLVPM